jgi:hypothetical protein
MAAGTLSTRTDIYTDITAPQVTQGGISKYKSDLKMKKSTYDIVPRKYIATSKQTSFYLLLISLLWVQRSVLKIKQIW